MIVTLECPVTVVFQADVEDPSNIQPEEIDDAAFGEAVYYQILKDKNLLLSHEHEPGGDRHVLHP